MSMTINNMNKLFAGVFGWNNNNSDNDSSSLFGTASNLGINLTDYATIKSGAYHKLLKAYYTEYPEETEKTQDSFKKNNVQTKKERTDTLARIENSADTVKDAADALLAQGSKSVFAKVEKTDEKGNKTTEYDTDAIYKSVDKFVRSYNSMLDKAGNAENNSILRATLSAVQDTEAHAKALEGVGITVGSDNKLSLDQDTFQKADVENVKSLFNKTGSYGYQVSAKASMISFYAERATSQAVMYGENGTYNYTYPNGDLYNIGI